MSVRRWFHGALLACLVLVIATGRGLAQDALPPLDKPVNDFANVIDAASESRLDTLIRKLQSATGDTMVVATRPDIAPFADERELAVQWFANRGRGIGDQHEAREQRAVEPAADAHACGASTRHASMTLTRSWTSSR